MNTRQSFARVAPWALSLTAVLLAPLSAQAHELGTSGSRFVQGFAHPFSGLDHVVAMLAVGLWATQLGGRSLWAVPAAFVAVMTGGAVLGSAFGALTFVEQGVAASVLVLGLLIAAAVRLPLAGSAALVGIFALFHGHVHGSEMAAVGTPLVSATGFIAATILLHLCGIGIGLALWRVGTDRVLRIAGGAVAACGIWLCMG